MRYKTINYCVKPFDTLYSISKMHNIHPFELQYVNQLFYPILWVGQVIKIPIKQDIRDTGMVNPLINRGTEMLDRENINGYYTMAQNYLASKLSIPANEISALYEATASFPETNVELWAGKVLANDNIYTIYINKGDLSLHETDEAFRIAEEQAVSMKYGKLDPELYQTLASSAENEEVNVAIWINTPEEKKIDIKAIKEKYSSVNFDGERPEVTDYKTLKEIQKELNAEKKRLNKEVVDPVVSKISNAGIKVKSKSELTPSIFASITKKDIKKLESMSEVDTIYKSKLHEPQSSTALATTMVYELWKRGYNGGSSMITRTTQNQVVEILVNGLSVRVNPSTASATVPGVASLNTGERYAIVRWDPTDWVEIKINSGTTGWIFMNNNTYAIGKYPGTGEIAVVTADTLNIRQGPSTTYTIVDVVYKNAELIVLEVGSSWTYIKTMDGIIGWVSNSYIIRRTTGYSPTNRNIRVAVIEAFGIDPASQWVNQNLADKYNKLVVYNQNEMSPHPTMVAGCIVGIERGARGFSPGVTLLDGNATTFLDSDLVNATDWAVATGNADIINCSFGSDSSRLLDYSARYYDHISNEYSVLAVVAAGNANKKTEPEQWAVISPALGYNVLSVGAMLDKETGNNLQDDEMATTFSRYIDPISEHNDRKKPELSAPGENIYGIVPIKHKIDTDYDGIRDTIVTESDGATNFPLSQSTQITDIRGTSFAAPFVTGIAADLMEVSVDMVGRPELARAVLMAGAIHELRYYSKNGVWEDMEGVGTVNAFASYKILTNGWYAYGTWDRTAYPKSYTISIKSGQRLRAVVAWNSQTTRSTLGITSVRQIDLDLLLYDANNNLLTKSNSFDNTEEVIEYVAPADMTLTIRIIAPTHNISPQPVGIAWNIY